MSKTKQQYRGNSIPTFIILGLLSLTIGFTSFTSAGVLVRAVAPASETGRVYSAVVGINYDSALAVFPGNGSSKNPYMITNLAIAGNSADYCISIQNTRKCVLIYNCLFTNETSCEVLLRNATNVVVSNNTFCGGITPEYYSGAFVDNCTNVTISGNWFTNNTNSKGAAITVYANDTNVYVTGNQISSMEDGIYVGRGYNATTSNVFLTGNLVSNCSVGITLFNIWNGHVSIARNTINLCTSSISMVNSTNVVLADNIIINPSTVGPSTDWYQIGFYFFIGVVVVLAVIVAIQVARGRKA